ncbi:MAG: acetoin dehydrogenase dihydrolipoyllysine-residue acetyltransferase subunit, partial [Rhodospirillaceae bacterium]|nr:acetoin dehydrogenase dihydrolipoyllysine-residue acetyltransferase subunit [Rhodospirillaceae bacterium]
MMSDERIQAITVPKWGMAMEEGTVTGWHLEEGATVAEGDEVLDVESTKIANVIEAKGNGILRRRVAAEGTTLPVGGLLAVIASDDVSDEEIDGFVSGFVVVAVADDGGAGGPVPR